MIELRDISKVYHVGESEVRALDHVSMHVDDGEFVAIIGVLSLVVLVSLVNTSTSSVTSAISSMGSDLLTVKVSDDYGNPLKLKDIDALMEDDTIGAAAPMVSTSVTAASSYSDETATVYGTTAAYYDIKNLELASGRFLKRSDVDNHTNVVVINSGLATEVMGRTDVAASAS